MARVSDGTDVPVYPVPASSSNMGSPNGSILDLDGTGFRACTMEEKINEIFTQIAKLPLLMQRKSRFENCVQTLSQTVVSYDAKITNIEQIVSSLAARVAALETNATSVSSGSGSGSSWNVLGHGGGSTATGFLGSHGQGWSDDSKNGVDLTLSQALKMSMHGVPSYYGSHVNNTTLGLRIGSTTCGKNQTFQPIKNPSEFIAKQVPCQPALYLKHVPSVRTLWPDIKKMVFPMKLTVLSATPNQLSRFANSNRLKTGKSESNLRLRGENWPNSSKF